jgi:hypothetical protein
LVVGHGKNNELNVIKIDVCPKVRIFCVALGNIPPLMAMSGNTFSINIYSANILIQIVPQAIVSASPHTAHTNDQYSSFGLGKLVFRQAFRLLETFNKSVPAYV